LFLIIFDRCSFIIFNLFFLSIRWFLGFDWDGLSSQLLIPPFVRPIAHPTDVRYFDRFPCDVNEPPDELSGWDADF